MQIKMYKDDKHFGITVNTLDIPTLVIYGEAKRYRHFGLKRDIFIFKQINKK